MQEELDAYDRIQRETEQVIEQKNKRVSQLEEFISEKLQQPLPSKTQSNSGFSGDQDSSLNSQQALQIQELEQMLQRREQELDECRLQIEELSAP